MSGCHSGWILAICVVIVPLLAPTARGEMPPHIVLERPVATGYFSPYSRAVKVQAQPYPYGYFGACGHPHWQRQFGINRTYTQWSVK